jgi:hypothetical protein
MKKYKSYITTALLAGLMCFTGCSDNYMTEMNTDPSKAPTIDPNAQLTLAELETYGQYNIDQVYRNYIYAFTQQLMGCWNTTNYGGRFLADDNEMSRLWIDYYSTGIKNLTDLINNTKNDSTNVNITAMGRIYRVYMMSIITDIYGNVPYFEAGKGFIDKNSKPKFDSQKDIYADFFKELKEAGASLNENKKAVTGDVIYKGDVAKWKKFANALRMRFAMRISDVDPATAQTEFESAMNDAAGYISAADDDALIHYMSVAFSFGDESYSDYRGNSLSKLFYGNDPANNPSYICSTFFNQMLNTGDPRTFMYARCYYDGLMSLTSPDNRIDVTDEVVAKGLLAPRNPGDYSWEPWPSGYYSDKVAAIAKTNSKANPNLAREVEPKLANNFLKSDNPGVIITSAEVNLLLAEAKLKGWNVSGDVQSYYNAGVTAAIRMLTNDYGCTTVSDADIQTYLTNNGIGHTAEQAKQAINTQAWILHFTNPSECWANVRRSGYPRLAPPDSATYYKVLVDSKTIPVRLCYPVLEGSYNHDNYVQAIEDMGIDAAKDNWNVRVWWDTKN